MKNLKGHLQRNLPAKGSEYLLGTAALSAPLALAERRKNAVNGLGRHESLWGRFRVVDSGNASSSGGLSQEKRSSAWSGKWC